MADITAIILTKNEEVNIEKCILSIQPIVKKIIVIDSYSTDKTVEIALENNAEVYQHEFENQSKQFIFGITRLNIQTMWVLRIDADEELTPDVRDEIETLCKQNTNTNVNGIVLRFEVNFMGKKLRHGGVYPFKKLNIFKYGIGYMEERCMDEHIVLESGTYVETQGDCIHKDYKDITYWINKHNSYASREVQDYMMQRNECENLSGYERRARFKRMIKYKVYYRLPMGMRAYMYYIYRYYFKLGFLDGKEGKIYAFLQAYWYRYLVDVKIYEMEKIKKRCGNA